MLKKLALLFCILLFSTMLKAATGCVATSNNIMYLQKTGSNYRSNGTTATLGVNCNWIYNSPSTSCNVNGGIGGGFLAQSTPQNCPIDGYTLAMLVLCCAGGYMAISKTGRGLIS